MVKHGVRPGQTGQLSSMSRSDSMVYFRINQCYIIAMRSQEYFDLVIIGGGLVGASLACALRDQSLKIALIDKTKPVEIKSENFLDAKALALSHISVQILKTIQVWQEIEVAEPLLEVHISKQNKWGVTRIRAAEHRLSALGYVVNADFLNQTLNQTLAKIPNLTFFCPDEISQLTRNEAENNTEEKAWTLQLSSGKIIQTSLLVAADGSESYLRKHQGIAAKVHDYQQTAIVVNIGLEQSHQGIAFERFTTNGSIAMLPFGTNQVKCVWVVPTPEMQALMGLSNTEWLEKIQANFGYQLGQFKQLGRRITYPLRSIYADALYGDRVVFIGNAANTLHPVAAQGFNLGLRDVATLAELLVSANNADKELGSLALLKEYAALRKIDHQTVAQLTDRLSEPSKLQWLGVLACSFLPPFKNGIVKKSLGLESRLGKLSRGISLNSLENKYG